MEYVLPARLSMKLARRLGVAPWEVAHTSGAGQFSVPRGGGVSTHLSWPVATSDPSGAAVVTGRQPLVGVSHAGPPIAAGILPPGSSGIGVITTDAGAHPLIVSKVLDDGTVIFALKVASAKASDLGKNSIKAVTWTSFDGTKGRINVTQKQS